MARPETAPISSRVANKIKDLKRGAARRLVTEPPGEAPERVAPEKEAPEHLAQSPASTEAFNGYQAIVELLERPEAPSPPGETSAVLRALLRSWWIIVLCGVVGLAAGLGVDSNMPKTYTATTYVLLSGNDFQQAVAGGYTPASQLSAEATAIALLTPQNEAQAAAAAGLRTSEYYAVNISSASNSSVINVDASTRAPRTAATLADAAAAQIIAVIKRSNAAELQGARATVQSQLAAAKRSRKQPLAAELNSFATLEALANQSLQIIQHAAIPGAPSGPGKTRAGAIALVLGLILGAGIALLRRDRRRADSV